MLTFPLASPSGESHRFDFENFPIRATPRIYTWQPIAHIRYSRSAAVERRANGSRERSLDIHQAFGSPIRHEGAGMPPIARRRHGSRTQDIRCLARI